MSRYYPNSEFNLEASQVAHIVTDEWLSQKVVGYVDKIAGEIGSQTTFGGAYTGLAGVGYGLMKAADMLPAKREKLLREAERLIDRHLNFIKTEDKSGHRDSRFLLGNLGVYVICALLSHVKGESSTKWVDKIERIGRRIVDSGEEMADDELFVGRAGYLAAVSNIWISMGEETIDKRIVKDVALRIIASGRAYAASHNSSSPLMFEYHGKQYLGAAHGLIGILHMLLSFRTLLEDADVRDVLASVDWLISIQDSDGNVASNTRKIGVRKDENELVQWCHGASGFVPLLIVAYTATNEQKYLNSAQKAMGLIWEKGILLKGPGICHGVASGGYAFLLYYRATGDAEYLRRSRCFALAIFNAGFQRLARTPDRPLSLFEGIAGTICFLVDLAHPEKAQFPLVPIRFPEKHE